MNCCVTDLRNKEVINAKTGCRLGQVCDVEIDTCTGCISNIVIWGRLRFFGFLGRDEDIRISWNDMQIIGDDTILVCCDFPQGRPVKRKGVFENFFRF